MGGMGRPLYRRYTSDKPAQAKALNQAKRAGVVAIASDGTVAIALPTTVFAVYADWDRLAPTVGFALVKTVQTMCHRAVVEKQRAIRGPGWVVVRLPFEAAVSYAHGQGDLVAAHAALREACQRLAEFRQAPPVRPSIWPEVDAEDLAILGEPTDG